MEIQELNIINLQNPSLFSRNFSHSGTGKVPQVYSFWKWGALILALVATFGGMITRIKLSIVRFCKFNLLASSGPLTQHIDHVFDSDEDDSTSSDSSDDDEPTTSSQDRHPIDEDFRVAGSSCYSGDRRKLRRRRSLGGDRFSWSDFTSGKSVVKLWDNLGLGLDFDEEFSESVVSLWDLNEDRKIRSLSGERSRISAISTSSQSPAVIFSTGSKNNDNVFLGVFDTRIGSQIPAMYADWSSRRGTVVRINSGGGGEKFYVGDDVSGTLTVGDMRNVKLPLQDLTESEGDTWWDADAVIVSDEVVDDSVQWEVIHCRDEAK
ncbi:unnamed protein product [Camellia sinensis]